MNLDPTKLKITQTVIDDSVLEGPRLSVPGKIDPDIFLVENRTEIESGGLTPAKALYLAMLNGESRLPTHTELLKQK